VGETCEITFYGTSFIAGPTGEVLAEASDKEAVITATVDLDGIETARRSWGLFRDRRPDLYGPLMTLGGT
jgi:N-carbamoylputrescine amidase